MGPHRAEEDLQPACTLHKPTGEARVRIDGRDHYLGVYGSRESRLRYDDLIAEWFARRGDIGNVRLRWTISACSIWSTPDGTT